MGGFRERLYVGVAVLEYAVFAIAAFFGFRLALARPLRRDAAAKPMVAAAVAILVLMGGVAGLWLTARWPFGRHAAVLLIVAGGAGLWWRARASYGVSRHWPAGSLGLRQSLAAIDDRRFYSNQAQRYGPIFKMSQFGRPVVCIVGFAKARALLSAHAASLEGATLPYNRLVPKGSLRYMAQGDHRSEAPVFRSTFHAMEFAAAEEAIRDACRAALAQLAQDSAQRVDGVRGRDYFNGWLLAALARLFFGLAPNDDRVAELGRWVPALAFGRIGGPIWKRRVEAGIIGITSIMHSAARGDARTDGSALDLLLRTDPNLLADVSRTRNLILIFRIALGDLTGLLDWIFKFLGDEPGVRERVRLAGRTAGEAKATPPLNLATCVVMETLRLEQSEFLYRKVATAISFDGLVFPAGWLLRICTQESHRDPAVFADPERFLPERFRDRPYSRSEYSPFGADERGCMGGRLAHFLGRVFVEELCVGFDWRVVRDGPVDRGTRHRHHWRPSEQRRVVMTALPSEDLSQQQSARAPQPDPRAARSTPV